MPWYDAPVLPLKNFITNRKLKEALIISSAVMLLLVLAALMVTDSKHNGAAQEPLAKKVEKAVVIKAKPPSPPIPCHPKKEKCVYLTFDDGPFPLTPKFTSYLKKHRINATFFVLAVNLKTHRKEAHHYDYAGFTIGNHSDTHRYLPSLSSSTLRNDLSYTSKTIKKVVGVNPTCYRPPYGATNARVRGVAKKLNLREILWDVDPQDWARPGTDTIVRRVMAQVHPGAVILLHDGGGDRSQTLAALPIIVKKLKAKGYGFASFCDSPSR